MLKQFLLECSFVFDVMVFLPNSLRASLLAFGFFLNALCLLLKSLLSSEYQAGCGVWGVGCVCITLL